MIQHEHGPEETPFDCEACRELAWFEASLDPEDLVDLRINSIIERYNHAFRSDLPKDEGCC